MSIRFGWTRPQAGPETTDDDQVEDVSSAPSEVARQPAPDAGRSDACAGRRRRPMHREPEQLRTHRPVSNTDPAADDDGRPAMTQPTPDAVQAIWEVHARVVETERKTHRRIGAAAARPRATTRRSSKKPTALHDARLRELRRVRSGARSDGDDRADAAPRRHERRCPSRVAGDELRRRLDADGDTGRSTVEPDDEPETAGETIGRIRVLLGELGIEPGVDPLQAAKQFLDVVESPDDRARDRSTPAEPRARRRAPSRTRRRSAGRRQRRSSRCRSPKRPLPSKRRHRSRRLPKPDPPVADARPRRCVTGRRRGARARARARRALARRARARTHRARRPRPRRTKRPSATPTKPAESSPSLRNDLELAREAARTADAEIAQRTSERDDAGARSRPTCESQLAPARATRRTTPAPTPSSRQRERDRDRRAGSTAAQEQIAELETPCRDRRSDAPRVDAELDDARARPTELETTRDQLAARIAELELIVARALDERRRTRSPRRRAARPGRRARGDARRARRRPLQATRDDLSDATRRVDELRGRSCGASRRSQRERAATTTRARPRHEATLPSTRHGLASVDRPGRASSSRR